MAMNARLLRPIARFDPRQISGCICNLDASVLSSLRQNSDGTVNATATDDPVGYWADLSGLGNHAVQSVATGSRPFLKLNNQNGRPGLLFDGSNDWMTATIAGFQSLPAATVIIVSKPTLAAAADSATAMYFGFGNNGNASGVYPSNTALALASLSTGTVLGETIAVFYGSSGVFRLNGSSTYLRAAATAQMLAVVTKTGSFLLRSNDASVSLNLSSNALPIGPLGTGYTVDNDVHLSALRSGGNISVGPEHAFHQFIVYDRELTAAEQTRIWVAMRAKWGIV